LIIILLGDAPHQRTQRRGRQPRIVVLSRSGTEHGLKSFNQFVFSDDIQLHANG
jgi:hypothetical protein